MTTEKFIKDIISRLAVQQLGIKLFDSVAVDSVDDGINLSLTKRANGESLQLPANIPSVNTSGTTL